GRAVRARLLAEGGLPVAVHAFLDGSDTPPKAAMSYLKKFQQAVTGLERLRIASLCGRYFAMDRDKRWDRVEKAYRVIVEAAGDRSEDPVQAMATAYARGETDEFV